MGKKINGNGKFKKKITGLCHIFQKNFKELTRKFDKCYNITIN